MQAQHICTDKPQMHTDSNTKKSISHSHSSPKQYPWPVISFLLLPVAELLSVPWWQMWKHPRFMSFGLEMAPSFWLLIHWTEFSHQTPPNFGGGKEMQMIHIPGRRENKSFLKSWQSLLTSLSHLSPAILFLIRCVPYTLATVTLIFWAFVFAIPFDWNPFPHSKSLCYCLVTQSCLTLQPHGLQHARLPCPSLSPKVCSDSCSLSKWCHPTISSLLAPFSSYPQSFPALGSFLMTLGSSHQMTKVLELLCMATSF